MARRNSKDRTKPDAKKRTCADHQSRRGRRLQIPLVANVDRKDGRYLERTIGRAFDKDSMDEPIDRPCIDDASRPVYIHTYVHTYMHTYIMKMLGHFKLHEANARIGVSVCLCVCVRVCVRACV